MSALFNKLLSSLKSRGIKNTIFTIKDRTGFETKCFLTSLKLNIKKFLLRSELVINHGKYKFNFYGGGDRGEILYHAFWDKMFLEEMDKIKKYIKPGDTVIDIGGNLGFFILLLNELVGPSGKIYSFEPSKILKARLEATVKNNNLQNVIILNHALGESDGVTTLHYNPKQSGLTSIVTNFSEGSLSEEITVTTLDKFSEQIPNRVSFIKIDTEGYEPQVLKGSMELIIRDKPTIYIELGGEYQASSVDALKILNELNYYCEAENLDLKTIPAGVNFIATPKKII
jgi:FkbM family methyltransferase